MGNFRQSLELVLIIYLILAGISFISLIREKVEKKERLSLLGAIGFLLLSFFPPVAIEEGISCLWRILSSITIYDPEKK